MCMHCINPKCLPTHLSGQTSSIANGPSMSPTTAAEIPTKAFTSAEVKRYKRRQEEGLAVPDCSPRYIPPLVRVQ